MAMVGAGSMSGAESPWSRERGPGLERSGGGRRARNRRSAGAGRGRRGIGSGAGSRQPARRGRSRGARRLPPRQWERVWTGPGSSTTAQARGRPPSWRRHGGGRRRRCGGRRSGRGTSKATFASGTSGVCPGVRAGRWGRRSQVRRLRGGGRVAPMAAGRLRASRADAAPRRPTGAGVAGVAAELRHPSARGGVGLGRGFSPQRKPAGFGAASAGAAGVSFDEGALPCGERTRRGWPAWLAAELGGEPVDSVFALSLLVGISGALCPQGRWRRNTAAGGS